MPTHNHNLQAITTSYGFIISSSEYCLYFLLIHHNVKVTPFNQILNYFRITSFAPKIISLCKWQYLGNPTICITNYVVY